jgi:glucokinase
MSLSLGIDVGGTKVAAGVVDPGGRVVEKLRRSTPASAGGAIAVIGEVIEELRSRHQVAAVGLGVAGFVDETRCEVRFAPHLPWREEPVQQKVEGMAGVPVVVENDANASAWGEVRFGAARGEQEVVFVGVGTGIGTGLVLGGRLYRGRWGMAGEAGHYQVVAGGRPCACGKQGCWEQYASGTALAAEARAAVRQAPAKAARLLELAGGSAAAISGMHVTQAAREGDAAAVRCFEAVGTWLGHGLAALAAILDPACFVVGGGVSEAGDLLLGPARHAYQQRLTGAGHRHEARIMLAELGTDAGLVGASDLARSQ